MAFSEYSDLHKTTALLGLIHKRGDLLVSAEPVAPDPLTARQLDFHLTRAKRPFSEMYAREYLIAPLFSFAQMRHDRLNMYSNDFPLECAPPTKELPALVGLPDYLVTYPKIPEAYDLASQFPLLAVAEAKNETFNAGWAQCAAELYACRLLNESAGTNGGAPLWGIVTNGLHWEFGKMLGDVLTIHHRSLDADPLDKLLGALDFIFADCIRNGEQITGSA